MPSKIQKKDSLEYEQQAQPTISDSKDYKKYYKAGAWLTVLAVLALIFCLQQFYHKKQLDNLQKQLSEQMQKSKPGAQNQTEVKDLIEAVKKLIVLPDNENPTIATVTDLEKLKGQQFFANAQIGDKVLIYPNSKKAVLYRPSTNQVVDIAPLGINAASNTATANAEKYTVEIRNASGKTGLASLLKQKLSGFSQFDVQKTGNSTQILEQTLVVDLTGGKNPQALEKLASLSGGKIVQAIPNGETTSNSQILILVGKQ